MMTYSLMMSMYLQLGQVVNGPKSESTASPMAQKRETVAGGKLCH